MWPCKSVVCRIEIRTVSSSLDRVAARVIVGAAQNKPARPTVLRNARRVGELTAPEYQEINRIDMIVLISRTSLFSFKSSLIL
jgi:hypothetical protein